MQFKNVALFLSVLPAAMASLPLTLELLVFQNGQRIGCVDIYGKFVTNARSCFPFRAMDIPGSDNKHLWTAYGGKCSADSGVLECYETDGEPSEFTVSPIQLHPPTLSPSHSGTGTSASLADIITAQNGADLELVGAGTAFSASSVPALDSAGADIIVGDSGSEKFFLQVRALSG
ncbi:hypothetical protein DL769_003584 [Monosporascus sp. CRB-8-3]|nr:hypothetical protein DL769_003584 [Monosporascus sp. CRB-8-3]